MPIIILRKKDPVPAGYTPVDCTSASTNVFWRQLSPFYLGPVTAYDGLTAQKMENAWQYTKVYPMHMTDGEPNAHYFEWRDSGFASGRANRYPMGRYGMKPEYSLWKEDEKWVKLGYIEARRKIYIPLYSKAIIKTVAFSKLLERYESGENIALIDFDGYNYKEMGMSYENVISNSAKPLGHAFLIAMLIENTIKGEKHEYYQ